MYNVTQFQLLITVISATDFVSFTTLDFRDCVFFLLRAPFPGSCGGWPSAATSTLAGRLWWFYNDRLYDFPNIIYIR